MIDTTRGSLRIRSWPKPRPGPRHPTNEYWSKWLKAVTYLYRYQPATVQWQLQEATKGTIWMPRDIFISAVRGRAWLLQDDLGRTYYPMAFVNDVSESLDAIAQLPGQMMYRGEHLWLPIEAGTPGQILAFGADAPEWQDASGGGASYAIVRVLGGNPALPTSFIFSTSYQNNSARQWLFDFDELPLSQFRVLLQGAANAVGQTVTLQVSTNASPTDPISAAGDDMVINTNIGLWDSGWIDISPALTGLQHLNVALKGSNTSVALQANIMEIHLRNP